MLIRLIMRLLTNYTQYKSLYFQTSCTKKLKIVGNSAIVWLSKQCPFDTFKDKCSKKQYCNDNVNMQLISLPHPKHNVLGGFCLVWASPRPFSVSSPCEDHMSCIFQDSATSSTTTPTKCYMLTSFGLNR